MTMKANGRHHSGKQHAGRATLPDIYHKCGRCLLSLKVEGHGLPKGWTVVLGRLGKQDELRCEQCVIDVKGGSPEQL